MIRLHVSPDMPWTIGRALGAMELAKVFLVVDDTSNDDFKRWIEGHFEGSLGHFEHMTWTTQNHKKHFGRHTRVFRLLLLAQRNGNSLFGRLGQDEMKRIFSQFVQRVYVRHISYEPQTADWDEEEETDKEKWLTDLFEYWNKKVEEEGWEAREFSEMGVSVCGEPDEDSVCCSSESCDMCAQFKASAAEYGIYEP